MANLIVERVELARRGENAFVICKMNAGWLVVGDVQPLRVGNAEPALHTHIIQRYRDEPDEKRRRPVWVGAWVGYDCSSSRRFDLAEGGPFIERMRRQLGAPTT